MNCQSAQRLISAARDGALGGSEQAALDAHLAECAGCRSWNSTLGAAADSWRTMVAVAPVPDAKLEWQRIQRQLAPPAHPAGSRRHALWWGLSLAATAATAVVLMLWSPQTVSAGVADLVEVGAGGSATVYVDAQSGWLVVWAVEDANRI